MTLREEDLEELEDLLKSFNLKDHHVATMERFIERLINKYEVYYSLHNFKDE